MGSKDIFVKAISELLTNTGNLLLSFIRLKVVLVLIFKDNLSWLHSLSHKG